MSKLDDLFSKKKDLAASVLDLASTICHSKDDYKRLQEKVPDFKMRPIKQRQSELKVSLGAQKFHQNVKEQRKILKRNDPKNFYAAFANPIPIEMRSVCLKEMVTVQIDWRMLTNLRPRTKTEEEYFSRLLEMGKAEYKTTEKQTKLDQKRVRKVKNRSGIIESRPVTCVNCLEEFCNGKNCIEFGYDHFDRKPEAVVKQGPKPHVVQHSTNKKIQHKKRNKKK